MEVCPVYIEHVPKIIEMRRHLVQMQSKFPPELLNLFENMEQRSNPWESRRLIASNGRLTSTLNPLKPAKRSIFSMSAVSVLMIPGPNK